MLFLIQPIEDRGARILHRALAAQIALLVPWFLAGTVLTTSYKSLLLSTLIPIRYDRAIESVADAADSGLPLLQIAGTAPVKLVKLDRRPGASEIASRMETFIRQGKYPTTVRERRVGTYVHM